MKKPIQIVSVPSIDCSEISDIISYVNDKFKYEILRPELLIYIEHTIKQILFSKNININKIKIKIYSKDSEIFIDPLNIYTGLVICLNRFEEIPEHIEFKTKIEEITGYDGMILKISKYEDNLGYYTLKEWKDIWYNTIVNTQFFINLY